MAESAEDLYARIVEQVGADGHLPMTPAQGWDVFPWEVVDGAMVPKVLAPPLAVEAPREGDPGGKACTTCDASSGRTPKTLLWENDDWILRPVARGGLPLILMLETKEHVDFTDLDDDQAAELGRLSLWVARIMESLDGIGRTHVMRIGDGSAHLHIWFVGRPERFGGILGSFAVEYDDMLPQTPLDPWLADQRTVARKLAQHDGRALI
ncbi:MAG TPA: hypothetical protein VFE15_15870 [Marmoricola sp.]|jgi:diadenosine tetraphosphate (Ap4A) HIT family hydrolase|nr:hypothetical protein [Marmoricola sp.]